MVAGAHADLHRAILPCCLLIRLDRPTPALSTIGLPAVARAGPVFRRLTGRGGVLKNPPKLQTDGIVMKVRNSLKSLRGRHRDNKIVRRKGRVYVINKTQPRFKARQG